MVSVDILVLNTAVVDFRRSDFKFVDGLVGEGGLAKCKTKDMPSYSQEQFNQWIKQGFTTAGGPGNTAPLIAKTGLKVAVGVNLGKGDFDGLDAQGRYFYDIMVDNNIDMSETYVHQQLPTGTTFIHEKGGKGREGIAYFPNANNDFDFEYFKQAVGRLNPKILYCMYSGLSDKGDTNNGRDLADFINWSRTQGIVSIVGSHTLAGEPYKLISPGTPVAEYKLLMPLLPVVDLFFTSSDEARIIENTFGNPRGWAAFDEVEANLHFLDFLTKRFWKNDSRTKMFGITVSNGAYEKHMLPDGSVGGPSKIESSFMDSDVIDLIGAGDSFRAGLVTYIAHNLDEFTTGSMNFSEAIQTGNFFAALFIKAPLHDRCQNIKSYEKIANLVCGGKLYAAFYDLMAELSEDSINSLANNPLTPTSRKQNF